MIAARRLVRFAREVRRVDAVLVFSAGSWALAEKGLMCMLARSAGRGVVVRLSSGSLPAECQRSPILERWLRLMLRSAHVVCSQGPFWTAFFGRYPEASGKVVEVPNGIPLPPPRETREGRGDRLVFVGVADRAKGIFELLEAFRRLHPAHPDATLTFVGGGPDLEKLRAATRTAGLEASIATLGWVPTARVADLLREHDAFLLPSHYEGLPNALLEAMAAGLPVIATRVGSIPDVITTADNGLLIAAKDIDALTAAMTELLESPERARAMGRRGRQTVETVHDIERVWPRYAEAIDRALGLAGRSPSKHVARTPSA